MSNTNTSPNMNLPVPAVAEDPGPDWATNTNSCWSGVDGHDHSSGKGVQVPTAGMNINADLNFASNNAYAFRSARFTAQGSPLALAADIGCLYVSGADLYYNDVSGNQVRITTGGNVNAGAGSITGLPSGTASVAFAAAIYTFNSATSTPATIAMGPAKIGRAAASPKYVTMSTDVSQASDYAVTFPVALPAAANYLTLDNTGAIACNTDGTTGAGRVVLATSPTIASPTFSGTSSGIITSGTYTPTVTAGSQGSSHAATANSFSYMRVGNQVTVFGQLTGQTSGTGKLFTTITVPINPTSNFAAAVNVIGVASVVTNPAATVQSVSIYAIPSTKTISVEITTASSADNLSQNISFTYSCA